MKVYGWTKFGGRTALLTGVAAVALSVSIFSNEAISLLSSANAEGRNLSLSIQDAATAQPSFADMVERVQPAVVSIRVQVPSPVANWSRQQDFNSDNVMPELPNGHPLKRFFEDFGSLRPDGQRPRQGSKRTGQGSGFIISADGYVVTNNHVVDTAQMVEIILSDGREFQGKVVGRDDKTDLALVRIEAPGEEFSYVEFASGETTRVGDWVVAVGNPYGLGGTVTAGIVSARGREIGSSIYDDFLQIDAPINRGNSGGPTFNMGGEVVGVNTAIFSPSGGSVGIGFAIPASTAKRIIDDLKDDGSVVRGWLGVQIQELDDSIADSLGLKSAEGALVTLAQPDSPAVKAGLRAGDTIQAVDGEPIDNPRDLARTIGDLPPGKSVTLDLWRGGKKLEVAVKLGALKQNATEASHFDEKIEAPAAFDLSQLGLQLTNEPQADGVTVLKVDPGSAALDAGLNSGHKLLEVDGEPVQSANEVALAIKAAVDEGKSATLLRIETNRGVRYVAIALNQS